MPADNDRDLRRHGYITLSEVQRLLSRIGERMSQIDEPLAREYVIDPYPDGIERKIHQLCERRKALFNKLAEKELREERDRLTGTRK